jgi:hypothetical protein
MPVHHVHMNDRSAATFRRGNFVCQAGKIRRENGWRQLNHGF